LIPKKSRIRRLPVVKGDVYIGIVTDRDFAKPELPDLFSSRNELDNLEDRVRVCDITIMEVTIVIEDIPFVEVVNLPVKPKINGLPVISRD
jgi:CBS domain-containing protein